MKRAGQRFFLGLVVILAAFPTWAGCGDDIAAVRAKLGEVQDSGRRQELALLLDKAEKDAAAGRAKLCDDTVRRAQALLPQAPGH